MADIPEFQKKQYAFAAHIRDPDNVAAPEGVEDRRMAIYRELFFNNIRNLLATMFPVLRKLHSDDRWHDFIRQFMQQHRAETPYFLQLPQEFLTFLQNEYQARDDDYPFLVELAHYEYIEIALSISEDSNNLEDIDPEEFTPSEPAEQPVFIAVYRRTDDSVGFLELNPITARLLEAIDDNDGHLTGEALLRALATEINYADVEALVQHGAAALEEMRQLEILTGTRVPA
jgi:hypothetical protein